MVAVGDPILLETTPGFLVASSEETSDSTTFTAETEIGSITGSLVDGVEYEIAGFAQVRSSVLTDLAQVTLREDSTSGTQIDRTRDILNASADGSPQKIPIRAHYTATASGSKTFVLTCFRVSGTGNIQREAGATHPQLLTIKVAN